MSKRYSNIPFTEDSNPPDLELYVKGSQFNLHKEILAKKSAKVATLHKCNKIDELRWILRDMDIDPSAFEVVARFCYGYKIHFSSENIVSVLCIAYYLEMNDDHSPDNLLNKAVTFLEQRVLVSWNETMKALHVCSYRTLDNLADAGLMEVFLQSLVEMALNDPRLVQELVTLPLRLYESLMVESIKLNVSTDYIAISVRNYTKRWVLERDSGDESVARHKREVLEVMERLLPEENGAISCGFLSKTLKESITLDACSDCRQGFQARLSKKLHRATSEDLMILLSREGGTYDIELLKTILESYYGKYNVSDATGFVRVARVLEEFLYEAAASDAGLKVETFKKLGEIVVAASCEVVRYSDGIYKAINVFLERRKDLIETEKMEVCRLLDCKKLSPQACEHASNNEKLPLRIVVQVLSVSQMQIRDKVAREMKGVEEKVEEVTEEEDDDDEIENMNKKLLNLEIESDNRKKRKIENLECIVHREKKMKQKTTISGVWREVKRKFGCMTSFTVDACDSHIKKRNKTYHHYK